VNGKVYIGFAGDPEQRWRKHKNDAEKGRGYVFHQAIRKHGWHNFVFEVLCCGKDKRAMLEHVEPQLIQQYRSSIGDHGYNMHRKVIGASGRAVDRRIRRKPCSDETRRKLSEVGKGHHRGGWKFSDETRTKMSASRSGAGNANFGKAMTEEQKQKISKAKKGTPLSKITAERSAYSRSLWWTVTYPDGQVETIKNLKAFCRERGLWSQHLRKGPHKGYRAEKLRAMV
jgi:group I intron endonuclease